VALVGDSHAGHWRAALDVVAKQQRWRGISLAHTHCPLTTARRAVPEPERSDCVRFNAALRRWLGRHPEVSVVFVSQISGGRGFIPGPGQSALSAAVSGFVAGWKALPHSVEHIVVLHDTPKMLRRDLTLACVSRALAAGHAPGPACAQPRSTAIDVDPAAIAAGEAGTGRVQTVDMTRHLCDAQRCYPVIGGALVYKDQNHLTTVFAKTLAPFVGEQLQALGVL
jgi:hypothetical protein